MTKDLMSPERWASEWNRRKPKNRKDKVKQALRRWALRDFNRMLGKLIDFGSKPEMDIIELGCAPGQILKDLFIERPAHNYTGIDYSLEGLAITRNLLEDNGIEAELIHADIQTYVPVKTYDIVFSFGLIEHFNDPTDILNVHKKFVSQDGWVIASVPNLSNYFVQKALKRFRPIDLETHNLDIMNRNTLQRAFTDAGFCDIRTGGAVGPLLPTPMKTPTLQAKAYKYFSYMWNGSIRLIPPRLTWYGYYWAGGRR